MQINRGNIFHLWCDVHTYHQHHRYMDSYSGEGEAPRTFEYMKLSQLFFFYISPDCKHREQSWEPPAVSLHVKPFA